MRKLLLVYLIIGAGVAIYFTKFKPSRLAPAVRAVADIYEVKEIHSIELPDEANSLTFYNISYTSQKGCIGCPLSHICMLEKAPLFIAFFANWVDGRDDPGGIAPGCERSGGATCQANIKGTAFFSQRFKQFYAELMFGQHEDFKECLTADVAQRSKVLNAD